MRSLPRRVPRSNVMDRREAAFLTLKRGLHYADSNLSGRGKSSVYSPILGRRGPHAARRFPKEKFLQQTLNAAPGHPLNFLRKSKLVAGGFAVAALALVFGVFVTGCRHSSDPNVV